MKPRFSFGSIVVVKKRLIGVVVKCWGSSTYGTDSVTRSYHYEVYVRDTGEITDFREEEIQQFIHGKGLTESELFYYTDEA